jgi:predicted O-methyltransferase YrrM
MLALSAHRLRCRLILMLAVSWSLCCSAVVWAQTASVEKPAYETVPRSADGIGKRTMGREIAGVMGWQAAGWLEREEREKEERTDLLVKELGLKPGMVVADIGAGTGYFSRRIAARVGPSGKVYAVDVQPEMLRLLEALARQPGLANIQAVHPLAWERTANTLPWQHVIVFRKK